MRNRTLLAFILGLAVAIAAPGSAKACNECDVNAQNIDFCRPVFDNEVGATVCEAAPGYCNLSGSACSEITVGGGGSGGSGGGGGGCNTSSGFCPAACFSCSGGGRPRI